MKSRTELELIRWHPDDSLLELGRASPGHFELVALGDLPFLLRGFPSPTALTEPEQNRFKFIE